MIAYAQRPKPAKFLEHQEQKQQQQQASAASARTLHAFLRKASFARTWSIGVAPLNPHVRPPSIAAASLTIRDVDREALAQMAAKLGRVANFRLHVPSGPGHDPDCPVSPGTHARGALDLY